MYDPVPDAAAVLHRLICFACQPAVAHAANVAAVEHFPHVLTQTGFGEFGFNAETFAVFLEAQRPRLRAG